MRRLVVVALIALTTLSGCFLGLFQPAPMVRFQNGSVDIIITYGIRVGDAAHMGVLSPGETTGYYNTDPGSYGVEILNGSGVWLPLTDLELLLNRGKTYTAGIIGTFAGGAFAFIDED